MQTNHYVRGFTLAISITCFLLASAPLQAQLPFPNVLSPAQMKMYSSAYKGERFEDNRPKVSDRILERMKLVTSEEAWAVMRNHGYHHQFQGKWMMTHENPVLVGRAVTCNFIPYRPDIGDAIVDQAVSQGLPGRDKHWIMDQLQPGDVIVADLMDKQLGGGFIGDNLANLIHQKTGTGAVIWGGARDLAGVLELEDFTVFSRNWDPSTSQSYGKTMITGYNVPIHIGHASVMPGDVILGLREGVAFIPAHLALEVVETSEWTRLKDEFGHIRLREGIYTAGQIDDTWTDQITLDFQRWIRSRIDSLPEDTQAMIRSAPWFEQ